MPDKYIKSDDGMDIQPSNAEIKYVKIFQIEPNKDQPRKTFEEEALNELAESIKQFGILQPLLVCKKNGYYEIIAGERRWRAAKIAGIKEIPVVVKDLSYQEMTEISIIENIQRENLNLIEEAMAYRRLLDEFDLKYEDLAQRVFKSRSVIANSLRLLRLCDCVQQMLINKELTMGQVRPLIVIEDEDLQYALAKRIVDEKLSAREVEKLVKNASRKQSKKKNGSSEEDFSVFYEYLQNQMKELLGTKVTIHPVNNKKGKIEIEYYSTEELETILDRMR